jgi:hypothetical protein
LKIARQEHRLIDDCQVDKRPAVRDGCNHDGRLPLPCSKRESSRSSHPSSQSMDGI